MHKRDGLWAAVYARVWGDLFDLNMQRGELTDERKQEMAAIATKAADDAVLQEATYRVTGSKT